MSAKKFWISGLVVTVVYFLAGWLFYGLLLSSMFMQQGTPGMRPEPSIPLIFLSCLAYGVLMAFMYPHGYQGGDTTKEGMRFGILFALIVNLPAGIGMLAFTEYYTLKEFVIGTIWEMIIGAVLGIITAKVYGSSAKATAPAM